MSPEGTYIYLRLVCAKTLNTDRFPFESSKKSLDLGPTGSDKLTSGHGISGRTHPPGSLMSHLSRSHVSHPQAGLHCSDKDRQREERGEGTFLPESVRTLILT